MLVPGFDVCVLMGGGWRLGPFRALFGLWTNQKRWLSSDGRRAKNANGITKDPTWLL
jgi:hypothetical protein